MKKYIHFISLLAMCLLQMVFFAACDSDDSGNGQPVITGVRSVEASKADSLFTDGERWQIIVLVGENLNGAKEIYINDQKVPFNTTYATSTHIILTIPEKLKLVGEDPSLPAEIRVVTTHGTATYAFHVNSPAPYMISYGADWDGENPLVPGQEIRIKGENFYEVKSIYLSETNPIQYDDDGKLLDPVEPEVKYEITDYDISSDFDLITARMPAQFIDAGYIVVECYSGVASLGFRSVNPEAPVIEDISSDMPVLGEPCTIYGSYFKDVVEIIIGKNEINIPAKDITANEDFTQLVFALPKLPETGRRLILVTETGRDTVEFYNKERMMLDFDNIGAMWWGGTDSGHLVKTENAGFAPAHHSGVYCGIEGTTQIGNGWWGPIYSGANIPDLPDSTPVSEIEFRYECYMHYPLVEGMDCWFIMFDGTPLSKQYVFDGYKDRISGTCEPGRWMTCSIPLSEFTDAATYGEVKECLTSVYLHLCNAVNEQEIAVYFDNFRMYVKQ